MLCFSLRNPRLHPQEQQDLLAALSPSGVPSHAGRPSRTWANTPLARSTCRMCLKNEATRLPRAVFATRVRRLSNTPRPRPRLVRVGARNGPRGLRCALHALSASGALTALICTQARGATEGGGCLRHAAQHRASGCPVRQPAQVVATTQCPQLSPDVRLADLPAGGSPFDRSRVVSRAAMTELMLQLHPISSSRSLE
jgi:hypothetical protein